MPFTRGIDAEVGNEAVLGGDAGKHLGVESLGAGAADRIVRGQDEDARVAVERRADALPGPHGLEDRLGHALVGRAVRGAFLVEAVERPCPRVQCLDPDRRDGIGHEVEHLFGRGDRGAGFERDPCEADARADDDERPAQKSGTASITAGRRPCRGTCLRVVSKVATITGCPLRGSSAPPRRR